MRNLKVTLLWRALSSRQAVPEYCSEVFDRPRQQSYGFPPTHVETWTLYQLAISLSGPKQRNAIVLLDRSASLQPDIIRQAEKLKNRFEIRIRAERRAGQLLAEIQRARGGDRKSDQRVQRETSDFVKAKEQANISDMQAHRWQQLAAMPHEDCSLPRQDSVVLKAVSLNYLTSEFWRISELGRIDRFVPET
jgi:hypothetical protein